MITKPTQQRGFTLIEIMVAIAVLAILLSIGVGSYSSLFKRNELRGASESLYSLITYAKSEAIKSNAQVAVTFASGANGTWCAGLRTVSAGVSTCDCNNDAASNSCSLLPSNRIVKISGGEFKKITIDSGNTVVFDNVRGLPIGAGNVVLTTDESDSVKVEVNAVGNVKTCTVSGSSDYAACS